MIMFPTEVASSLLPKCNSSVSKKFKKLENCNFGYKKLNKIIIIVNNKNIFEIVEILKTLKLFLTKMYEIPCPNRKKTPT